MSDAALYAEIEPFQTGFLKVSDIHSIYFEVSGNAQGKPVVYLHGGPGTGSGPRDRRYFNPVVYKIILLDQRGAGRSTPPAEIRENTTWDLVEDLEKLRHHLGVGRWVVFGGSWGSTLALAYTQTHPGAVEALILRGIFLLTREELRWAYQEGCNAIYPDAYDDFIAEIPEAERGHLISAYYRRLTSQDDIIRKRSARAWSLWEMTQSQVLPDKGSLRKLDDETWTYQHSLLECHYFTHGGWLKSNSQLLDGVAKIRHIPSSIIQGRYDVVCPLVTAWRLHKAFPEAEFHIEDKSGHSAKEDGMTRLLVQAADKYSQL